MMQHWWWRVNALKRYRFTLKLLLKNPPSNFRDHSVCTLEGWKTTVKLISAEGFEFVVDKEAAMVSQTIHNMLTSPGNFAERRHGEVTFPEICTTILEKICQYFYWHLQFASGKETELPIESELTLELMVAANYLHT
ncbi:uncharacterized protein LOC130965600 [Arachis stenosperma]|uniref:uncharacterized protein LOC130965600 n=1 Tax=Arachis stenosperma TaxID=217475 RepID=UPI0025AC7F17|nr:uncharacterized protein LOC130965600 [Arachis stenosperma]